MCLNPKKIVNPSTWIDPTSTQALYITVPCNHCSECIVSYRNEWRNRAYFESLDTFIHGGYVLFDTLTYRNGNLPHLSDFVNVPKKLDFPCFSYYDVRHFIANLRIKLTRLGYDISRFKHFLACEYGDDIRYTRRPHYHVLFFVPVEIPYKVLSKTISATWIHGRTDGVEYRGAAYVSSNCVFTGFVDSAKFSVNYVTKYCTKQFSYLSLVEKRLNALCMFDFDTYLLAKEFVCLQHFQSKGFGHNALISIVGRSNLLENGYFRIIDKNGLFRNVNLHKSLQRKLLYDYSRDEHGRVHFTLNSDGFLYKKKFYFRQLNYLFNLIAPLYYGKSSEIRQQIFNLFFVNDRFNSSNDISYIIDHSYNIFSGLRNYSSCDYSFVRKSIFTSLDYGSQSLGYVSDVSLSHVKSIPKIDSNEFIDLNSLKSYIVQSDIGLIDDFFSSRTVKGDDGLDVLKLKHRLDFIHKFNYA